VALQTTTADHVACSTTVGATYCNYAWYNPNLASSYSSIYLVCSSTAPPTFTAANDCQFISGDALDITGGCTTSGSGCVDQTNDASNRSNSNATTVSAVASFTNEIIVAMGGNRNDEPVTATNGGTMITSANVIYAKTVAGAGSVTLGQSWTGAADIGGILMMTIKTPSSVSRLSRQPPVKLPFGGELRVGGQSDGGQR